MSFAVKLPLANGRWLEWAGSNLDSVFAQRRNLVEQPEIARADAGQIKKAERTQTVVHRNRHDVAIGGDSIRSHYHAADSARLEEVSGRVVGDQRGRDAVLLQFPSGQTSALQEWSRLVSKHIDLLGFGAGHPKESVQHIGKGRKPEEPLSAFHRRLQLPDVL